MKTLFKLFLNVILLSVSLTLYGQQKPPYERTRTNQVMSDYGTWAKYFLGLPHGATPVMPPWVPDSLKDGALYRDTTAHITYNYNKSTGLWEPQVAGVPMGSASPTNYGAFFNADDKLVNVTGFTTDGSTYFAFSNPLYYNAPNIYTTGIGKIVKQAGGELGIDTTTYVPLIAFKADSAAKAAAIAGAASLTADNDFTGDNSFEEKTIFPNGAATSFFGGAGMLGDQLYVDNFTITGNATTGNVVMDFGSYPTIPDYELFFNHSAPSHLYWGQPSSLKQILVAGDAYTKTQSDSSANKVINKSRPRQLVVFGSSLSYSVGRGGVLQDTATYAFKVARKMGFVLVNKALPGRNLQQTSAGDSSMYSTRSTIPPYVPGSYLFLEGQVNDENQDTTVYNTTTYATELGAIIDTAVIGRGYPASHIKIINPSSYGTQSGTNHGIQPNRHYNYNYASQAVATAKGCGFYDLYFKMKAANNINPIYVASDSLHTTAAGQKFSADSVYHYLSAFTGDTSLNSYDMTLKNSGYVGGNLQVKRDLNVKGYSNLDIANINTIYANGPIYAKNYYNKQVSTISNIIFGGNGSPANANVITISPSFKKTGNQAGYIYADTTTLFSALNYSAVSASLTENIGGGISDQLAPTDVIINTGSLGTFGGSPAFHAFSTGNVSIGKLQNSTDPGLALKVWGKFSVTQEANATLGTDSIQLHKSNGSFVLGPPIIPGTMGGTGVNNGAHTITVAANFALVGSALTFTTSGSTSITLPTSGTMATLAGTETFLNKTFTTPKLTGYTVATLPTGAVGMQAYVTDASSPTSLSTVVGGGSTTVKVFYSGINWIVQ